ncbi:MAG: hypothetical protein ABSE64_02915 [Vulcanimicrobiaceae bacterium]|jgi:hypothetical protein
MKFGWPYPRRIDLIEKVQKQSGRPTAQVPFQGTVLNLPLYNVPIEMPKYRLNNGRTEHAQKEYIATHDGTPDDFFTRDHESEEASGIQNELLQTMVDEQGLLDYFRKHVQEMPLILTADGFVLNGNRRLCAYRTLLESDPKKYDHFQNLQVVILPPCDERDLDRLESKLQREPDIRAKYSWIADAVKYRKRLLNKEFTLAELAVVEDVPEDELTQYVSMLGYAEQYLSYRGTPYQYRLLSGAGGGDSKYAFEQLVKFRAKVKGAERQAIFTNLVFAAMVDPHGSMYKSIPLIFEHLDHIVADLAEAQETPGTAIEKDTNGEAPQTSIPTIAQQPVNGVESTTKHDPATSGIMSDITTSRPSMVEILGAPRRDAAADLVQITSKIDNASTIRTVSEETVDHLESLKKEKKKKNFVYSQILKANTALKEARNALSAATTKTGVAAQLNEASETIAELMTWAISKP